MKSKNKNPKDIGDDLNQASDESEILIMRKNKEEKAKRVDPNIKSFKVPMKKKS